MQSVAQWKEAHRKTGKKGVDLAIHMEANHGGRTKMTCVMIRVAAFLDLPADMVMDCQIALDDDWMNVTTGPLATNKHRTEEDWLKTYQGNRQHVQHLPDELWMVVQLGTTQSKQLVA